MNFMERNPELRALIRDSGVTSAQITKWVHLVGQAYLDLASGLPDGHVWKAGKLEHVQHGMEEARKHAALLGLEGVEIDVVGFLFFSHDVGRLSQALRAQRNERSLARLHGIYSVQILTEYLEIFYITPFWQAVFAAIAYHASPETPRLRDLSGNRAALALTSLLRDMDKREGFLKADKYTQDAKYKRKQIEANWAVQRKTDPTWGEEKKRVEPDRIVQQFARRRAIDRDECQSYEAYMLQYLAWLFDIENPEILHMIMEEGHPNTVFRYLERQLARSCPAQWKIIRKTYEKFTEEIL